MCSSDLNVIGGGDWSKDRIVPDVVRAVFESNEEVILRNPNAIRPWQHVLDPLFGYLMLAKGLYERNESWLGAWNFAPREDNFISVEELTRHLISAFKKGEYSIQRNVNTKPETQILKLDATKARSQLGWRPLLNIQDSLSWTADWYSGFYAKRDVQTLTSDQIKKYLKLQQQMIHEKT